MGCQSNIHQLYWPTCFSREDRNELLIENVGFGFRVTVNDVVMSERSNTRRIISLRLDSNPHFSAHVCCGQMALWIKMPLGTEVGLSPGDIVLDGNPATPMERGTAAPLFSARVYCGEVVVHLSNCWPLVGWLVGVQRPFSAQIRLYTCRYCFAFFCWKMR